MTAAVAVASVLLGQITRRGSLHTLLSFTKADAPNTRANLT